MSYIGNQPVLNTSEFREEFAVTSTQTVFNTGGFTASSDSATLEVLRNGVLLGTADYTLGSDASTVTLANAAVNGDIIVIKGRRELTNGVQVTERRHEHTMGAGETSVTFPYPLTVSQTDVYLNGVKLGSSDFSINSSTRVVSFTTNPAVGDLVAIVSREPALTANSSLPVVDATGNNVLSESGSVVTLTADEANVGSNALVVNSSGDVGIGTSNPATKIELAVPASTAAVVRLSSNKTGSGSGDRCRWENYSSDNSGTAYELGSIEFDRADGTGTSSLMTIKTRNSGTVAERMRIDSSGDVTIAGSSLAASILSVDGYGKTKNAMACRVDNISYYNFSGQNPSGTVTFFVYGNGDVANTNNSYSAISDIKLKENITDTNSQWNDIKNLRVVNFNFTEASGFETNRQIGFIAQEVELVSPGCVDTRNDIDENGNDLSTTTKSVKTSVITVKAIKALQEAMERIESQQSQIDALTARIEALETPAE